MKIFDYENIVSHLDQRGYENPAQIIEDFIEGRLMGNDVELYRYLDTKINGYKKIKPRINNSPKMVLRR